MKGIDTGKDKVKKICDVLRRETLEPAKKEAEQIIEQARVQAKQLLMEAKEQAEAIRQETKVCLEKEQEVFQSSLNRACKQTIESLKQEIEQKLFQPELNALLEKPMQDTHVLVQLIEAVVKAIEKEGLEADLSAWIPKAVSSQAVTRLLSQSALQRLRDHHIQVGPMQGGVEVKIHQNNIIIDLTDRALKELLSKYIRKEFREILFNS